MQRLTSSPKFGLSVLIVIAFVLTAVLLVATALSDAEWLQWTAGIVALSVFLLAGLDWLGIWSLRAALVIVLMLWLALAIYRIAA